MPGDTPKTLESPGDRGSSGPSERAAAVAGSDPRIDLVGRNLLHLRVVARLGEGGMGVVYKAIDEKLRRPVALKVLASRYVVDERNKEMIFREARSAAAVTHPNIASIYEVHDGPDGAFYVMELVEGETLRDRITRVGRLPVADALGVATQIARALARAHDAGMVHRDLKADNVMITPAGEVKLLDFGLAKVVDVEEPRILESGDGPVNPAAALAPTIAAGSRSTLKGRVVGTPAYMAPEQARGEPVDPRADVFAFGVVLFEMLTGKGPFAHRGGMPWTWGDARSGDWKPTARVGELSSDVPPGVEGLIERCMAFDRDARYANGAVLVNAVEHAGRRSARARRPALVVVAATVAATVALAGAVAIFARREPRAPSPEPAAVPAESPPTTTKGVRLMDLPAPVTSSPRASAAFRDGLQAFHSGRIDVARAKMEEAIAADPTFAAAYLRLAHLLYFETLNGARQPFLKAIELRAKLSPRDDAMLTGLTPCLGPEVADYHSCAQAIGKACAAFPDDADLLGLWGGAMNVEGDLDGIAHVQRAIEIDPHFVPMLLILGSSDAYIGRSGEGKERLRACLEESPGSGLCLSWLAWMAEQDGDRAAFSKYAQAMWVNHAGQGVTTQPLFAETLYVAGEPREAVLEALEQHWRMVPEAVRGWRTVRDRAALAALDGDFAAATTLLAGIDDAAIASDDAWRWVMVTRPWFEALAESGDAETAAHVATQLRKRLPALPVNVNSEDWGIAEEPLPLLLEAQLRGGAIDEATHVTARNAWVTAWVSRTKGFVRPFVWLHGYAARVETPEEARAALVALTSFEGVPPLRPLTATNFDLGRMYLLAGKRDDALPYLKKATQSSAAIEYPFAFVRSRLWYGRALADGGDKDGACTQYASVVAQWGGAKPRSITAEEARTRAKALGCALDP